MRRDVSSFSVSPRVHSFSYPHDLCLWVKSPVIARGDHFLGIKVKLLLFLLLFFSTSITPSVNILFFFSCFFMISRFIKYIPNLHSLWFISFTVPLILFTIIPSVLSLSCFSWKALFPNASGIKVTYWNQYSFGLCAVFGGIYKS